MAPTNETRVPPKFPRHTPFFKALQSRVDAWFEATGKRPDGGLRIVGKSLVILAWYALSYALLLGFAATWWQALLAVGSLALAGSAIGFNVMHDGGHRSYSRRRWLNRASAFCIDLIGGSSYIWNQQHNRIHHHYTNVDGTDDDIVAQPWLRLAPGQPLRPWHRWQFLSAWALYSFLPPKWLFYDDFATIRKGRIGTTKIPRPRGRDLAMLIVGKVFSFSLFFGLPLALGHAWWAVAALYVVYCIIHGVVMSTVFQLAHCVEEAHMVELPEEGSRLPLAWAEHQLATTVDFCPRNPLLHWFLGGLNFQIEHHLFPRVSHVHYPAIAPIVREVCAEFEVPYQCNDTLVGALGSHVRFLRRMGSETEHRPLPQPVPALGLAS